MASFEKTNGADGVVTHAGGKSPGVGREDDSVRPPGKGSGKSALLKKAGSVAVGMMGLALIGLVSEKPTTDRLELSNLAPALGDVWLAGASTEASSAADALRARTWHAGATPLADSTPRPDPAPPAQSSAEPRPEPTTAQPSSGITTDGKVILNLATAGELTRLPGIGQKRAEKIVELRESLGRFKKLTDLLRIKGIGPKSLRKMLPYLVLDPPNENQGAGSNG
jgi:competence protein ComEA